MSLVPNSEQSFNNFFESWLSEQNQHLQDLISASKHAHHQPCKDNYDTVLSPLVERELSHYDHYYATKSRFAKRDVLGILSPSWRSSLEDAFLWIGGWRPSTAFHLLYSKSGLQFEARQSELLSGMSTGDLADLSPGQMKQVDQLQMKTIKDEKEISEKMAKQQERVADVSMIELAHVATELMSSTDEEVVEDRVESTLASKEEALEEILERADDLRLRTLKEITRGILTPIQAVHFLISAAELHLRLHDWGKNKDANYVATNAALRHTQRSLSSSN